MELDNTSSDAAKVEAQQHLEQLADKFDGMDSDLQSALLKFGLPTGQIDQDHCRQTIDGTIRQCAADLSNALQKGNGDLVRLHGRLLKHYLAAAEVINASLNKSPFSK